MKQIVNTSGGDHHREKCSENWDRACERASLQVFILNRVVLKGFHDEVAFEQRLKEERDQALLNFGKEHVSDKASATGKIVAYLTSLSSCMV